MQQLKGNGNDLITDEEIKVLKAKAITITFQDALEMRMHIIIPMDLKSGYGVSYSLVESPEKEPIQLLSIGSRDGRPDPADCEVLARAVLGSEYKQLGELFLGNMVHFANRRR